MREWNANLVTYLTQSNYGIQNRMAVIGCSLPNSMLSGRRSRYTQLLI